jgi:carboxypeptidase family protein
VCPANGAVDTRELVTLDNDPSHSYATTVRATVTYTDSTTTVSTAEGSAEVGAASGPPLAQSHTLTGVISDDSTRRGIGGARIDVISGANLGRATTADASGRYVLDDLTAGSFRLRASAGGYDAGEQGVAVPANPQADFTLKQSVGCVYTLSPLSESVSAAGGSRSFTARPSAASGCTWRASSSDPWITVNGAASGSGAAVVSYTVAPNSGVGALLGGITIQWASGRTVFSVFQYPARTNCQPATTITLSSNKWEGYVPLAVGCYPGQVAIDVPWVRIMGTHGGGTLLDVVVDANAGAARTGHIRFSDERVYLQITINQDASR